MINKSFLKISSVMISLSCRVEYCLKKSLLTDGSNVNVFSDISPGKKSTCNAGDPALIPGLGRSTGEGIGYPCQYSWASLVAQLVKNPPVMQEAWVGKIPWRRGRLPTPVFWPGLYSPWAV